ncbi:uncharacterized protein TM35_000431210 [Trypanosoma theileri]|uniref:Transmembrane protein n=1 Tax=Trypanosoma theileri TaxID=67003 RepID=A0A1X0NJB7_9TRYP|nr:uncharacterized protein TM35_000431210 [Trypanosoma theileri]ORC84553.1 hypothetical protein TM35_000431210 [Trypanosoma theileri]
MRLFRRFIVPTATQSSSSSLSSSPLFLSLLVHPQRHCTLSVRTEIRKRGNIVDDELTRLVLQCDESSTKPFGGSICGGILTLMGVGLCGLTFVYNVGKPVLDAYYETQEDEEGGKEEKVD